MTQAFRLERLFQGAPHNDPPGQHLHRAAPFAVPDRRRSFLGSPTRAWNPTVGLFCAEPMDLARVLTIWGLVRWAQRRLMASAGPKCLPLALQSLGGHLSP